MGMVTTAMEYLEGIKILSDNAATSAIVADDQVEKKNYPFVKYRIVQGRPQDFVLLGTRNPKKLGMFFSVFYMMGPLFRQNLAFCPILKDYSPPSPPPQ